MTDIEQQEETTVAEDQQSISDIMDAIEEQEKESKLKVTFPVTDNERTMLNFYKNVMQPYDICYDFLQNYFSYFIYNMSYISIT